MRKVRGNPNKLSAWQGKERKPGTIHWAAVETNLLHPTVLRSSDLKANKKQKALGVDAGYDHTFKTIITVWATSYLFIFIIIIILFLISVFSRENRIANIPIFFFFFTVYSQIPLAEQKTACSQDCV